MLPFKMPTLLVRAEAAFIAAYFVLGMISIPAVLAVEMSNEKSEIYFLGREGVPVRVTGADGSVDQTCNAVVFSQIPGMIDLFIGRARNYAAPGSPTKCEPWHSPGTTVQWLALYKMDWQTHVLSYVHDVLKPPWQVTLSRDRVALIKNAFDPSVISYNGELWVAFQCGGLGLRGESTCAAPLDRSTLTISESQRASVPIEGGRAPDGYSYSGAPPSLFVFRDKMYVYWSALQSEIKPKRWVGITIRGAALEQERAALRRLWAERSGGRPIASQDPNLTVEVAGIDPSDPLSDQSVDLKGVHATDEGIYVTAGLGGRGHERSENCLSAGGASYGCFRMQIFHSSTALGVDILNRQPLKTPPLPFNPTAYDRFFADQSGRLSILGEFFPAHRDYTTPYLVPSGMWSFPIDLSTLRF